MYEERKRENYVTVSEKEMFEDLPLEQQSVLVDQLNVCCIS